MKYIIIWFASIELIVSAPAMIDEIEFSQSDGSSFTGHLRGDEYMHWEENKNGDILVYNKETKNYDYAIIKKVDNKDILVASGTPYKNQNFTSRSRQIPKITKTTIQKMWREKRALFGQ